MFKNVTKIKSIFLLSVVGLMSCAKNSGYNYTSTDINLSNQTLKISSNEKSEGKFYYPENVNLTYTYSKLSKEQRVDDVYLEIEESKETNLDILIIPMHFEDSHLLGMQSEMNKVIREISCVFNGEKNSELLYHSVHDYFYISSFGKLNLNFTVADWYDTKLNSNAIDSNSKTADLIEGSLKKLTIKGQPIDRTKFDKNKDGVIDAIVSIYDVKDFESSGSNNKNLWAYMAFNKDYKPNKKNPALGSYLWASYSFLKMDKTSKILDSHLFIHEFNHLLGLNDYYDYNHNIEPLAILDMMCYNILDLNSYSKMTLGLMKPYVVYGNATINLEKVKNKNSCIVILEDEKTLIKDGENVYFNPFSEYILLDYFDIENSLNKLDIFNGYKDILDGEIGYKKTGWRLYHINSTKLLVNNDKYSFYNSHAPLKEKGKLENIYTNSTFGEEERFEEYNLGKYGAQNLSFENINYCNEITLIAKKTRFPNSFKKLYKTSVDGVVRTMPIDDDYLFYPGDEFNYQNYDSYFVKGKNDKGLVFDNNKVFSTKIMFE